MIWKLKIIINSILLRIRLLPYCGWVRVFCDKQPILRLHRGSRLHIDSGVRFWSSSRTNTIGVNHRVILATHTSKSSIYIGKNSGMTGGSINCWKSVRIGSNVKIGANTVISDSDFHLDDYRSNPPQSVFIGDKVWLGYSCYINKGVTINEGSIVAAKSVVTKDVEKDMIYGGVPANPIKKI